MSRGNSGRVVIELDPQVKRTLYLALAIDGSTLKDWFLSQANAYLASKNIQVESQLSNRDIAAAGNMPFDARSESSIANSEKK